MLIFILFSVQVFSQTFEEKVLQYLQKEFPEYQKIEIRLQQNFSSDDEIEIDYTRNINLGKGIAYIPVIATKGKKTSASIVSVKVQLLKKLLVANKDFERKDLLHNSGFEEKVLDVTRINGNPLSVDCALTDYRAKTFIKKGEILFEEKIEKIPLISSGDKVFAEVRNGNVTVTTEAFARQHGGAGDLIEFVSSGNKIFKARIIDATKVIVE
ncbi:MAG: flagellar basal body P-ring formation protein FlgA [Ignavibacteriales bacterium]|nr:flagellar basal body P-ring formation protein FlgA [Ignavibacteriales bacterium]